MFKSQNPYDEVVGKATDENLVSENWDLLLNVCEKVDSDGESGARDCIAAIQKRLTHRNANVQLYALTLCDTLVKNCGIKVHREVCSRAFTTTLTRLLGDRNTHASVKERILEFIMQWTNDFRQDPSLGLMEETYNSLKSQNYSFPAPDKPQKKQISDEERRKEEEELQMALALSLKETGRGNSSQIGSTSSTAQAGSSSSAAQQNSVAGLSSQFAKTTISASPAPIQSTSQTPAEAAAAAQAPAAPLKPVSRVKALYDFTPTEAGELAFTRGDVITVLDSVYKDWWRGECRGRTGIFPVNYVERLADPTPEDILREAEIEDQVFGSGRNVDKLLQMLSTLDINRDSLSENEELQNLYHDVIAIRPKLLNLIAKYSQKKDDLMALSKKFQDARQSYDEMMEASIQKYGAGSDYNGYGTGYGYQYGTAAGAGAAAAEYNYPPQGQQQQYGQYQYTPSGGPDPFADEGQGQYQQPYSPQDGYQYEGQAQVQGQTPGGQQPGQPADPNYQYDQQQQYFSQQPYYPEQYQPEQQNQAPQSPSQHGAQSLQGQAPQPQQRTSYDQSQGYYQAQPGQVHQQYGQDGQPAYGDPGQPYSSEPSQQPYAPQEPGQQQYAPQDPSQQQYAPQEAQAPYQEPQHYPSQGQPQQPYAPQDPRASYAPTESSQPPSHPQQLPSQPPHTPYADVQSQAPSHAPPPQAPQHVPQHVPQ